MNHKTYHLRNNKPRIRHWANNAITTLAHLLFVWSEQTDCWASTSSEQETSANVTGKRRFVLVTLHLDPSVFTLSSTTRDIFCTRTKALNLLVLFRCLIDSKIFRSSGRIRLRFSGNCFRGRFDVEDREGAGCDSYGWRHDLSDLFHERVKRASCWMNPQVEESTTGEGSRYRMVKFTLTGQPSLE